MVYKKKKKHGLNTGLLYSHVSTHISTYTFQPFIFTVNK